MNRAKIELHCHTKMSDRCGLISPSELVRFAHDNGYNAIAITDRGNVQAFPEAFYTWKRLWNEYQKECAAKNVDAAQDGFLKVIYGMEGSLLDDDGQIYSILMYAKNSEGINNLYRIVTESSLRYIDKKKPRIPRSLLNEYRQGLIVGAACDGGEVICDITDGKDDSAVLEAIKYYDFLEISPFYEWSESLEKICLLGKEGGKPVIAASDAYYINEEDEICWDILIEGLWGNDYKNRFIDRPRHIVDREGFLRAFVGRKCPEEIIGELFENQSIITNQIEYVFPLREGRYLPDYPNASEELSDICKKRIQEIYGKEIPQEAAMRLEKELHAIQGNGYSGIYMMYSSLVQRITEENHLVGSRGAVASSFVAYLCGITDINPLSKEKGGYEIPAEVFMGLEFDKEPDIDLNVAGPMQANILEYVSELPGVGEICRAGTISTISETRAKTYIEDYCKRNKIALTDSQKIKNYQEMITGIKDYTNGHPSGILICPTGEELVSFTPLMQPYYSSVVKSTSQFDCYSIDDNLYKMDILGYDGIGVLEALQQLTGVKIDDIPLDDEMSMRLICDGEKEEIPNLPEFGETSVRSIIKNTKAETIEDLIKISAISHGTDVWKNNQEELVTSGQINLSECIATRDDIMSTLMNREMAREESFAIMEAVRKGRGLKEDQKRAMKDCGIPDWYIGVCEKIKYLFPKAHATSYTIMAVRHAYFLTHYPEAYPKALMIVG